MKARPIVGGIAEGQRINVLWPVRLNADRRNQSGFSDDGLCHPLLLAALLHRDTLISAITAEAERSVTAVAPLEDRPARISELRTEIERLGREEEVLVEQAGVARRADADPTAILQVRVKETQSVAA